MNIYSGRLSRTNFAWGFVLLALLPVAILVLAGIAEHAYAYQAFAHPIGTPLLAILLVLVVGLICTIYYWSLLVRRLHDIGQTGWWSIAHLIPGINLILIVFLFITPGEDVANKYGAPGTAANFWSTVFRG